MGETRDESGFHHALPQRQPSALLKCCHPIHTLRKVNSTLFNGSCNFTDPTALIHGKNPLNDNRSSYHKGES